MQGSRLLKKQVLLKENGIYIRVLVFNAPLIVRLFLLLKNVCCLKSTVSEVPDTTRLGNESRSELVPNLAVKNDSSA